MMFYNGWGLSATMRGSILAYIPATRPVVRCDHVTHDLCPIDTPPPERAVITAYGVLDMEGYQVLAVMVNGRHMQPRGDRFYHVTMSHDPLCPSSHAGLLLNKFSERVVPIRPFEIETTPFVRAVGYRPK